MQVVESLGHGRLLLDDGRLTMERALIKTGKKPEPVVMEENSEGSMATKIKSFNDNPSKSKTYGDISTSETTP